MTQNPWNLTRRQCEVMDQLVKDGCAKVAMVNLGICSGSIYEHMRAIYKRMGIPPGTYRHILMWDRWRRQTTEAKEVQ